MKQRGWNRVTTMFAMLHGGFYYYGPDIGGLEAMYAGHADEFKETDITVNVVVPAGPAETTMVHYLARP